MWEAFFFFFNNIIKKVFEKYVLNDTFALFYNPIYKKFVVF